MPAADKHVPTFSTIYAFGDSLSDGGNLSLHPTALTGAGPIPPNYQETYATGTGDVTCGVYGSGPTWVQNLSLALGLGTLMPSLLGGSDFAFGGAVTGPEPQTNYGSDEAFLSLPTQLAAFEAAVPSPSLNALYTLWIGSNDLLDILRQTPLPDPGQQAIDISDAVANEMNAIGRLVHDGAENLLLVDGPDIGVTPGVNAINPGVTDLSSFAAFASQLVTNYNAQLNADLRTLAQQDGLNLYIVNDAQLMDAVVADPVAYGFTNVTDPALSAASADGYLFFDGFHQTEAGQSLLTSQALNELAQPVACIMAGTHLLTASGEVAVEALCLDDMLCSMSAARLAPISWLGQIRLDCRHHPRPHEVHPVRIAAHAFGPGSPHRALWLSPDHAVSLDGNLFPIRFLLNGTTITQHACETVEYWHVELASHAVIVAEGLAAESYLDTGNRFAFNLAPQSAAAAKPA